jgi:hypothetical protein
MFTTLERHIGFQVSTRNSEIMDVCGVDILKVDK